MPLSLILSAILPALIDFVKGSVPAISRKFFGESVDDQIKLASADIERLKALASLDNPYGTPSLWVVNLRASFRYVAAGALILAGGLVAIVGSSEGDPATVQLGIEIAGTPFAFIFGERLYFGLKGQGNK